MVEFLCRPMLLPPATIRARFREFTGLKEGIGRVDVDLAIFVAEKEVPKVVMLKFFWKIRSFPVSSMGGSY